MKIERKKEDKVVKLSVLTIGDAFVLSSTQPHIGAPIAADLKTVFLIVDVCPTDESEDDTRMTINLSNGRHNEMDENTMVVPVNATVVVQ